jgi:putative heme-binding domain-containing protein
LRPTHKEITSERIRKWLNSDDELLRLEAVRTLRESQLADRETLLAEIANDAKADLRIRCEAIVGIQPNTPETITGLVRIANGGDRALAVEALRSLRGGTLDSNTVTTLRALSKKDAAFAELVKRAVEPSKAASEIKTGESNGNAAANAALVDAWVSKLEGPADAAAGERIFFHSRAGTCANCHQKEGRGAQIGPDLTVVGNTLERRRLVESILFPSKEIAPQFVSWVIQTDGGKQLNGVLVGENVDGSQRYADATGKTFTLKPGEIESRTGSAASIMPNGLERQLTLQEFKDLLAYLQKR